MITIVDYDAGNIRSIVNMLRVLGVKCRIAAEPGEIATAEKLILPGVGHFDHGMARLEASGLREALDRRVLGEATPILGICLGAQLLTRGSEEGKRAGLGWIAGETVAFDRARMDKALRVPHMGWAETRATRPSPLAGSLADDARYYYVHSYHMQCDSDAHAILAARHGYEFAAGVGRDNILGVQFHPEKSHRFGLELLRAFAAWQPSRGATGKEAAA